MTGYKSCRRPGFVNFDYGFWDESDESFWPRTTWTTGTLVIR